MADKIQAVKGMHDVLPAKSQQWQALELKLQTVLENYGYAEIRMPVLEKTELFTRSIGDATDIVNKEMYTFSDRNDEQLTLRPEGTASCVRAVLEHSLLSQGPLRTWYKGPMFRYERPQRGRFRQFHQVGAEVFGIASADIDAELILMCKRFWRVLGIADVRLELNTLGTHSSHQRYRNKLVDYFSDHQDSLDADSQRRLAVNPLRILDSKNPAMQDMIQAAPVVTEYLDQESSDHFQQLQDLLNAAGLAFSLNPRLVRGLDYYNHTVFEWITDKLGAQGTVCAGGRYDGLVEQIGGKHTPAVGFAMGLERLLELIAENEQHSDEPAIAAIYFLVVGAEAERRGLQLIEKLRDHFPQLCVVLHCGGGSFKSQFKKADKSGARLAVLLGEQEIIDNTIGIKPLRNDDEQITVTQDELVEQISHYF